MLPPASLRDWRYPTIVLSAAVLAFFLHREVQAIPILYIQVLDAAALAIFALAGTEKALLHKVNPLVAVLLGTITGVGGGTIRDVLVNQVPTVLRFEVYASAALLGSICMIVATKVRLPSTWAARSDARHDRPSKRSTPCARHVFANPCRSLQQADHSEQKADYGSYASAPSFWYDPVPFFGLFLVLSGFFAVDKGETKRIEPPIWFNFLTC